MQPTQSIKTNAQLKNPPSQDELAEEKASVKRKKDEAKMLRKIQTELADFESIKKANRDRFEKIAESGKANECRSIFTPPEKRVFLSDTEGERSALTVGDFVEVEGDTSPGMNRECGCGFITEILLEDASGALSATVKYLLDGKSRSNIPLSDITVKDYQAYFSGMNRAKRKVQVVKQHEVKAKLDFSREGKSSIQMLRSLLKEGVSRRRPKGWHRRELKLNDKFDSQTTSIPRYNVPEMTQLVYEYDILSAWLEGSGSNKYFQTGRNGKVKKRKTKNNPDTLKYLLFAWGASFDTVSRFRKTFQESAANRGVTGEAAQCTNTMLPNENNVNTKKSYFIIHRYLHRAL